MGLNKEMPLEAWRRVWRVVGELAPLDGLWALLDALEKDDPKLLQGCTTSPPPMQSARDWPVEGACLIGWLYWTDAVNTVGEVEECFAKMCFEVDQKIGEPAGVRFLLNFYDDTPRDQMWRLLIPEVRRSIRIREASHDDGRLQVDPLPDASGSSGTALARDVGRPGAGRQSEAPEATPFDD